MNEFTFTCFYNQMRIYIYCRVTVSFPIEIISYSEKASITPRKEINLLQMDNQKRY